MVGVMCIGFESNIFLPALSQNEQNIQMKRRSQMEEWDELARSGGYTAWVEKTPAHICYLAEIFAASPSAKIVWIHRDPNHVASSLVVRPGRKYYKNISRAVDFWANKNRCVINHLPNRNIFEVAYSDFTSIERVPSVLANLSAFIGLATIAPDPLALLGPSAATSCHPTTCRRYASDAAKREDLHLTLLRMLVGAQGHGDRSRPPGDQHSALRSWQLCQSWYGDRPDNRSLAFSESPANLKNLFLRPRVVAVVDRLYPHLLGPSTGAHGRGRDAQFHQQAATPLTAVG